MGSADQLRAAVEAHVAAGGAGDAGALAALYAPAGRLYDPAGDQPVVGRAAIAGHFARGANGLRAFLWIAYGDGGSYWTQSISGSGCSPRYSTQARFTHG